MKQFYCTGCEYLAMVATASDVDFDEPIGGACSHPVLMKAMSNRTTFTGAPKRRPYWCPGKSPAKASGVSERRGGVPVTPGCEEAE